MFRSYWVAIWSVLSCASALGQTNAPANPPPTTSQVDKATLAKAVKQCVDVVRADDSEPVFKKFYQQFDAFYNPASGRVESNAFRPIDQKPFFVFKKCMSEKGMPVS
jgi:hypothetical protein